MDIDVVMALRDCTQRNVCAALARRQVDASAALQLRNQNAPVPRVHWSLARVLERNEPLVLLGFSRDGYFLRASMFTCTCVRL